MQENYEKEVRKLKREIILLKREVQRLQFKNSFLFRTFHTINIFIFIAYLQFIISYLFNFNAERIKNSAIQFKTYLSDPGEVKLYTISIKYKNYVFRSKINRQIDGSILQSDLTVTKDLLFHIPQKIKFTHSGFKQQWFVIYESMGILTICAIILFSETIAYIYKQNEHYYPFLMMSGLNILSFSGISVFSLYIHDIL